MNFNNGYYLVGERTFANKYEALLYSMQTKSQISYKWHHTTWSNFDRSLLGKFTLKHLYTQRAKQIREKYDYIVLFYSGGSDSWTVLNTFLENNIKIDCVCVRWPMRANNNYVSNNVDKTAFNYFSEWDIVIKKDLQWLAQHHSDIKIEIADWFEGKDTLRLISDDMFLKQNFWYNFGAVHQMHAYPDSWYKNVEKGLSVCALYGMDKPIIDHIGNDNVAMCFYDSILAQGAPNEQFSLGNGVEYFYWSPDFPLITYEQAYQYFLVFKHNPNLRYLIDHKNYNKYKKEKSLKDFADDAYDYKMHLAKVAIYPDWDFSKFQSNKPRLPSRQDKDHWLIVHPELKYQVDDWRDKIKSIFKTIHPQLLDIDGLAFKPHRTPFYFVGNYND